MRRRRYAFVALAIVATTPACGDGGLFDRDIPRSQFATVTQRVGRARIELEYSRPVARGRALFGALVPYGQPWNPGANDATKLTISRDALLDGEPLEAGAYSVWIIPDSAAWTFILSEAADVFHVPYPEGRDALRLRVVPRHGPHMETLAFYFPVVDSTHAELVMHWGEVVLPVAIDVR